MDSQCLYKLHQFIQEAELIDELKIFSCIRWGRDKTESKAMARLLQKSPPIHSALSVQKLLESLFRRRVLLELNTSISSGTENGGGECSEPMLRSSPVPSDIVGSYECHVVESSRKKFPNVAVDSSFKDTLFDSRKRANAGNYQINLL